MQDLPSERLVSDNEAAALRKLAEGKQLCVDLGTWYGFSAAVMAQVAERVVTIDKFGRTRDEIAAWFAPRYPNVEVRKSLTSEAAKEFADESVDVLFIDATHTRAGCRSDYDKWKRKVKHGGLVIFHDYNRAHDGVRAVIDEIRENEADEMEWIELPDPHGSVRAFRKR